MMTTNKSQDSLQQQLASLPQDVQPGRDLWQGIELAITQQPSATDKAKPKSWVYGAVAASILVPAVAVWISISSLSGPVEPGLDSAALIAQLSEQYESQKSSLLVTYQDKPALTDNWQSQLTELEDAAAAIKSALKHDPNNVALLRMLQTVYQQQIDLIERVHAPKWQQI
ncbi:hypothetical protein AltI4_37620 [Alteromonas sp. I4]|nr:hypothetical protein AltI4_37620 [Alteromonas sp. I4]